MAGRQQRTRGLQRSAAPHLFHHLAALLALAGRRPLAADSGPTGSPLRRRRQRLALAQRLLDPLPPSLLPTSHQGERFWQALRWGSAGMLLTLWLGR